ncbi:hypothetical protein BACOV975_04041 [Bacteroides ovatus V975]|nr:hypothetical protein BACOV975_04041 [Bacteroides ovatus V975]
MFPGVKQIVSLFETKCFNAGNKKYRAGKLFL